MITIDDNTLALWQFELPTHIANGNYLAALSRGAENKECSHTLTYRFRYYVDDKIGFESDDKRSWYSLQFKGPLTDDAAIQRARVAVTFTASLAGVEPSEFLAGSKGADGLMEQLKHNNHFHARDVGPAGNA